MADPSKRLEDAIDEYHKYSALPSEDIRTGRVVRQSLVEVIWTRLRQYRICKLFGPPRSGKTYLAFLVGWDIASGAITAPFSRVRYLDLATIKDVDEVDQILGKMDQHWLFIIDNCHLAADCHVRLIRLLQNQLKTVGLLLIETRSPEDKLHEPSPLLDIRQDKNNAPIDVRTCLQETAKGMVELYLQRCFGIGAECTDSALIEKVQAMGGHFDAEDRQFLMRASSEFKRMKGNLRFLSWRLQAWKPLEGHLRDLDSEEVLATVRRILVYPCKNWVGTLERIASLAQWELPYLRAAGINPPDGIVELQRRNVIAFRGAAGWQMDSTDAHLVMLANFGQEWAEKSVELTKDYLRLFPKQTPYVIGNVLNQAKPDTQTRIVARILQTAKLMNEQKTHFAKLVEKGSLNFYFSARLANCLLRDLRKDRVDANRRIGLALELFSENAMSIIGRNARAANPEIVMWFLICIKKLGSSAIELKKRFLDGYGTDNLKLIDTLSSCRFGILYGILRHVRDHDCFASIILKLDMSVVGESARTTGLQQVTWFLRDLGGLGAASAELKKRFLDGYGRDNLVDGFRACKSYKIRDRILEELKSDSKLFNELKRLQRTVYASPEQFSFSRLLMELMRGCIETGPGRYTKIHILEDIDEPYLLDRLKNESSPAARLQFLLHAALWLDPEQAERLAGLVPRIWVNLKTAADAARTQVNKDNAQKVGFLVRNCWFANRRAGVELTDVLRGTPLHSLIPPKRALGIGRFLSTMELVANGIIRESYSEETEYILQICEAIDANEVDNLLIALAAFAPDVFRRAVDPHKEKAQRVLFSDVSNISGWIRYAAIDLCRVSGFNVRIPEIPERDDIVTCWPAEAIAVIYGLQLCHGREFMSELLDSLRPLRETTPWIPLLIGGANAPLEPDHVTRMIRTILLSGREPRSSALLTVVLIVMAMKSVVWPRTLRLNPYKDIHRALETAIHEGILDLKVDRTTSTATVTLNPRHPFVRATLKTVKSLIEPIQTSHMSLSDWDKALAGMHTAEQADYYRAKLLEVGLLSWRVNRELGYPHIIFEIIQEPDTEQPLVLMDLVPSTNRS